MLFSAEVYWQKPVSLWKKHKNPAPDKLKNQQAGHNAKTKDWTAGFFLQPFQIQLKKHNIFQDVLTHFLQIFQQKY